MKIKKWLSVTQVEDFLNLQVDGDFYDSNRDDAKEIEHVCVQINGVVKIHTTEKS